MIGDSNPKSSVCNPNELPKDDEIIDFNDPKYTTNALIRMFAETDSRGDGTQIILRKDIDLSTHRYDMTVLSPEAFGVMVMDQKGSWKLDKKRLVDYLGNLRIVSDGGNLYAFDGCIYRPVSERDVENVIEETLRRIPNAPFVSRSTKGDIIASLRSLYRRDNIDVPDAFYDDPRYQGNLIPFQNGLYNIDRDELEPFTPFLFFTHILGIDYDPRIENHPVEEVYRKILPDSESREFFYTMAGYTLFSDTLSPPAIFVIYGPGNTGKTALQEAVSVMAGRENISCLDISQMSDAFLTAELQGKLLNVCGETGSATVAGISKADGELLKKLSEGQAVKVQRKYGQPFEMRNTAKLWFVSNMLPDFGDTSSGLYRRLHILPCRMTQKWEDQIYNRMQEPLALSWLANKCLVAYLRFIREGEGFKDSPEMLNELNSYRTQEPLMDYLEDFLGTSDPYKVPDLLDGVEVRNIYDGYAEYVRATGGRPLSSRKFAEKIRNEFRMMTIKTRGVQPNGKPTTVSVFTKPGSFRKLHP